MKPSFSAIVLFLLVIATMALAETRARPRFAYVVFNAQVVKVNIETGRGAGRIFFFDQFGSADSCALTPDQKWIVLSRELPDDGVEYAAIKIPELRLARPLELSQVEKYVDPQSIADPITNLVCHYRNSSELIATDDGPQIIDVFQKSSKRLLGAINLHPVPHECRFEERDVAITTKDRKRLLVLMANGYRRQSRLLCLTWPNLSPIYETGLLEICDYAAMTMYLPEDLGVPE